MTHNINQPAEI